MHDILNVKPTETYVSLQKRVRKTVKVQNVVEKVNRIQKKVQKMKVKVPKVKKKKEGTPAIQLTSFPVVPPSIPYVQLPTHVPTFQIPHGHFDEMYRTYSLARNMEQIVDNLLRKKIDSNLPWAFTLGKGNCVRKKIEIEVSRQNFFFLFEKKYENS